MQRFLDSRGRLLSGSFSYLELNLRGKFKSNVEDGIINGLRIGSVIPYVITFGVRTTCTGTRLQTRMSVGRVARLRSPERHTGLTLSSIQTGERLMRSVVRKRRVRHRLTIVQLLPVGTRMK